MIDWDAAIRGPNRAPTTMSDDLSPPWGQCGQLGTDPTTPDPIPDATLDLWEEDAAEGSWRETRVVALIAEVRRLRAELTVMTALTAAFIKEVKRLQDETKERQP